MCYVIYLIIVFFLLMTLEYMKVLNNMWIVYSCSQILILYAITVWDFYEA
jgi:hypothetical protein